MALQATDFALASRLLDEAMDLSPAEAQAWLDALPPEHAHLREALRAMLDAQRSLTHGEFLASGPRLGADSRLTDGTVAAAGDRIGPYRLIRELGRGGMGLVWLAERADEQGLKRQVAVKLPRLAWGSGLSERMARERDIGALLEHPHIARLYDAGVDDLGRPYLAMEYIDGVPLDVWCKDKAASVPERLRLFLQVTAAVAYAHARLVVHRDLKPSNVLVTADGQAHLLDFGIAKLLQDASADDAGLTVEQGRVLTPQYASPEQILALPITVASDVYSLGALLYELLTGKPPYEVKRANVSSVERAMEGREAPLTSHVAGSSTAKALRGEIDAIVAKALRRDPAQRYATAHALAQDIERHLHGERVLARPDSLAYRMGKALKRHRVAFAAAGAVLTAILGGAAVSVVQAQRANDQAERARVVKEFIVDIFKVNSPDQVANDELRRLPAAQLLERGARLIDVNFKGQPQLQAELYGVVGTIFLEMRSIPAAEKYVEKQIAALEVLRADAATRSKALQLLARVRLSQDRLADAESAARTAIALDGGDGHGATRARLLLADILSVAGRYEQAGVTLAEAERELTGEGREQLPLRAQLLQQIGTNAGNLGDHATAETQLRRAIELSIQADGPLSRHAARVRLALSKQLRLRDPMAAKKEYEAAITAMRQAGGAEDVEAAINQFAHLTFLIDSGAVTAAEALEQLQQARAVLQRQPQAVSPLMLARLELQLGVAYRAWGDTETAYQLIKTAATVIDERAERFMARFNAMFELFTVTNIRGDVEQASRLMARKEDIYRQARPADPHQTLVFDQIALYKAAADFDQAEVLAQGELQWLASEAGMKHKYRDWAVDHWRTNLVSLALVRAQHQRVLDLLERTPQLRDAEFIAWATALAQCGLGRHADTLPALLQRLEVARAKLHPYAPDVILMRAGAGSCALTAGNVKLARQLATDAAEAVRQRPAIGSWYRRPVAELQTRLGDKPISLQPGRI